MRREAVAFLVAASAAAPLELEAMSAEIRNAAYFVRHYRRGRTGRILELRRQAIVRLGLTVREAFNKSDDFEPLLAAIVDGLRPQEDPPAF